MKISGFSFTKNADMLYYPVAESIRSVLPICDEFVIAVGKGSDDDRTRDLIAGINDPKIRIIDTVWENLPGKSGHVFSGQTDRALDECTGDWCLYLQSDEVVHEKYLPRIRKRCLDLLPDPVVEGLLFSYRHFWGDYGHCQAGHKWYPREIRIVRNRTGVRSYRDAQSFRIQDRKLRVAPVDAEVFHYGWVRPPALMQKKSREMERAYRGDEATEELFKNRPQDFDYGPLNRLPRFKESHPAVMQEWIAKMDWKDQLDYEGKSKTRFNHDKLKYRFLTFLEQKCFKGKQIGGFNNYKLLKRK